MIHLKCLYRSNPTERIKNILRNASDHQIEEAYKRIGKIIINYY